jgi:transposase
MNRSPHTWKEARRLQAWLLRPLGWSPRQMAEALGVSEGAVSQWMTRARQGDAEALRRRRPPGALCRLTAGPLARVPTLLHQAPEAYGVREEVWTRSRMAAVIRLECDVTYPPCPMSAACAKRSAGAPKSLPGVPVSATTWRSLTGGTRPGRPSTRGTSGAVG